MQEATSSQKLCQRAFYVMINRLQLGFAVGLALLMVSGGLKRAQVAAVSATSPEMGGAPAEDDALTPAEELARRATEARRAASQVSGAGSSSRVSQSNAEVKCILYGVPHDADVGADLHCEDSDGPGGSSCQPSSAADGSGGAGWSVPCIAGEFGTLQHLVGLEAFAPEPAVGCDAAAYEGAAGRVAVVERGVCPFTDKAKAAAAAGVAALLIANTEGAAVPMGCLPEDRGSIPFPAMMVSREVGASLRAAVAAGADTGDGHPTVTLQPDAAWMKEAERRERQATALCNGFERAHLVLLASPPPGSTQTTVSLINTAAKLGVPFHILTPQEGWPTSLDLPAIESVQRQPTLLHRLSRFLKYATKIHDEDILLVVDPRYVDVSSAVMLAGVREIAARVCSMGSPIVLGGQVSCDSCKVDRSAFEASHKRAMGSPDGLGAHYSVDVEAAAVMPFPYFMAGVASALQELAFVVTPNATEELLAVAEVSSESRDVLRDALINEPSRLAAYAEERLGLDIAVDGKSEIFRLVDDVAPEHPDLFARSDGRIASMLHGSTPCIVAARRDVDQAVARLKPFAEWLGEVGGTEDTFEGLAVRRTWMSDTSFFAPFPSNRRLRAVHHGGRPSSLPFISGDTLRAWADWIFDGTDASLSAEDAVLVRAGDRVFVEIDFIDDFATEIHKLITAPYVLITHNGDVSAPGPAAMLLEAPTVVAWWAQNPSIVHPKLHALPIGMANAHWPHGRVDVLQEARMDAPPPFDAQRNINLYVNFDVRTNSRRKALLDQFKRFPGVLVHRTTVDREEYLDDMARSQFVVCPPGNGFDTHRVWEALAMGAVPIVIAGPIEQLYAGQPVLVVDSWADVTAAALEEFREHLLHNASGRTEALAGVSGFDVSAIFADTWFARIAASSADVASARSEVQLHADGTAPTAPLKLSAPEIALSEVLSVAGLDWHSSWTRDRTLQDLKHAARNEDSTGAVSLDAQSALCALAARTRWEGKVSEAVKVARDAISQFPGALCAFVELGHALVTAAGYDSHVQDAAAATRAFGMARVRLNVSASLMNTDELRHVSSLLSTRSRLFSRIAIDEARSSVFGDSMDVIDHVSGSEIMCDDDRLLILFVYFGELPEYMRASILQAHCFNPTARISVVAMASEREKISEWFPRARWVRLFALEDLPAGNIHSHRLFHTLSPLRERGDAMWHAAAERFYAIEAFMLMLPCKDTVDVLHLEGDVMLYADVDDLQPVFREYYEGIAATPVTTQWITGAAVYVRSLKAIRNFNEFLATSFLYSEPQLEVLLQGELNEMALLRHYHNTRGPRRLDYLPTTVDEMRPTHAHGGKIFTAADYVAIGNAGMPQSEDGGPAVAGALFDPASFGQFLDGTPNGDRPGFTDLAHYLGRPLRKGKLRPTWAEDAEGRRVPVVRRRRKLKRKATADYTDYRLLTLHVHSKNTTDFLTCPGSVGVKTTTAAAEAAAEGAAAHRSGAARAGADDG